MAVRSVLHWGLAILIGVSLLSGCGGAESTPVVAFPEGPAATIPSLPTAVQAVPTDLPPTDEPSPASTTDPAVTPDGTLTATVTATRAAAIDLPFLMRIDRISNIVGRGTLLEGQVAHGSLVSSASVTILGSQGRALSAGVLALLISNVVREQVSVGDYAGILVEGVDPAQLSPGMLLIEADAYDSYEEALQELQ